METIEIVELILTIAPALIAVFTMIGLTVKTLREFISLKKEVVDLKSLEEVKLQMRQILSENYELKQELKRTLSKIDQIYRE